MTARLVIVGCGGQGREIAAIATLGHSEIRRPSDLAFVDDAASPENLNRLEALGHVFLGDTDTLSRLPQATKFLVGIADGLVRERLADYAEKCGLTSAILVHPDATVGPNCVLGPGTVLWAGARLSTNVVLGRHVHVNQNVTIGHDTVVSDYATINPSASISGSVRLGASCLVGTGAVVLQNLEVGPNAIVGASACVTRAVPAGVTVKGVPAR